MALPFASFFISAAAPDGAEIEKLPSLLAIFGGTLSTQLEIDAGNQPKSKRDAFIRWLRKDRDDLQPSILLPESYDDWSNFNTYSDLLLFEEDLGYLTAAVVIFLEAPGSIAELGAFSQITSLRDRLVIVVTDDHHPKKSFISLGPLRQLESRDPASVCVIPDVEPHALSEDIDVIINAVEKKIFANKPRHAFDAQSKQHQFILALDLISIYEAITFTEIKSIFDYFKTDVNESRLHQILYTLEKSTLIRNQRYGGITYYLPSIRGEYWMDFRGKDASTKFNRPRVSSKIQRELTREKSERNRAHHMVFGKGAA
jgi:hypothetical protein